MTTAATDPYFLSQGAHPTPEKGRCAMEWVAYLVGEPHSDQPACVSPVLRRFCIAFNDRLGDQDRQKLRPYLARTIGTAGDGQDPERLRICSDWLTREVMPTWLDLAGRAETAQRLRTLPGELTAENVARILGEVREDVYEARTQARQRLLQRVREECKRRGLTAAAAAAAAAAYAYAYADAAYLAADAAYADAAYAAAADAADADADAAYADAAAYVVVAAAYAAAAAKPSEIRAAVYAAVKAKLDEALQPIRARHVAAGFELLERMLPKEIIRLPVAEDAEAVCALP